MTNFDTLLSRTRSLNEMRLYVESESFKTLTKKEQHMRLRALKKIELVYKGVAKLRRKPDLVIVVDGELMGKFVDETEKLHIDAIVLASSNFSRWCDKQLVMCNVNSKQSIDHVLNYIVS
ncbi:MAG: 30S ribosomal protein S2 [Candidatus Peribacteria bacterium]|nr:MAG: 30S ribosomal protein S2 [Candidatus Peribacteria bacterium]